MYKQTHSHTLWILTAHYTSQGFYIFPCLQYVVMLSYLPRYTHFILYWILFLPCLGIKPLVRVLFRRTHTSPQPPPISSHCLSHARCITCNFFSVDHWITYSVHLKHSNFCLSRLLVNEHTKLFLSDLCRLSFSHRHTPTFFLSLNFLSESICRFDYDVSELWWIPVNEICSFSDDLVIIILS